MSYYKTVNSKNGDGYTPIEYYKCDITGELICESDGWYGVDNIHISDNGIGILIEQWIKRESSNCGIPILLHDLEQRLTNKKKPYRYIDNKNKNHILNKYKHKCNLCGSKDRLEFDHIIPVSKGGKSTADNLQILCKSCNIKKSNK